MLKCNHHPIPFLFLKVKNICYQSVDVQRIWHCKSAEVSTRIPSGLPAQRFKSLIRRSSLVGWVKVVQKKWKNMGKPGGKHGKNHGKSLFFTSEILGNNDVRESGPVPWDRPNAEKMIEKSFQDGKQKDMFLSFFRIASVLSIWIYLAIGFLWWHVYFLPAIPSPWSKLAHCTRKKTHLTAAVHHPKTQRPWISPAESKGLEIVDHCRPGKGHESTGSNWSCIPDPSFS